MSQDKHESEFEEYLGGDSTLSTAYQQASTEQAPSHLDDAILSASRREVKSRPRHVFGPFSSDWHVPLSLAAVLVLSVTVIVTMQEDKDEIYLKAPIEYRPKTVSEFPADSLSAISAKPESSQIQDREDVRKEVLQKDFDSAYANEQNVSSDSRIMRREIVTTGKFKSGVVEEKIILPERPSSQEMSDIAVPRQFIEQLYTVPPDDVPMLREQERIFKSDNKVRRDEFKLKQQKTEFAKKRSAKDMMDKPESGKSNSLLQKTADEPVAVPSTDIAVLGQTTEDWLESIKQLWIDGYQEEAEKQLELFYENHPDFEEDKILQYLPPSLINRANSE